MVLNSRMLEESQDSSTICTYCQLASREALQARDLSDYWEEPSSFFMISGLPFIFDSSMFVQTDHISSRDLQKAREIYADCKSSLNHLLSQSHFPQQNHSCAGSLLKEAIEDLEWVAASGSVSLGIYRQPSNVTLSAYSAGSLQVKISVCLLNPTAI